MFKRMLLAVTLMAGGLPALAQVDSRLITSTDLLDVYKTTSGKPELLSIFDFSTSMHAMYWSSKYYGDISGHGHLTSAPNQKGWRSSLPSGDAGQSGIVPIIDGSGKVYMTYGGGPNGTPDFSSLTYMDNSGSGRLVRPDGSLVPISGTYNQSQLTALVQQASHIRMSATAGTATRTIDLPIPWAILDTTTTGTTPVVLTIPDTIGGGPAVCPDEAYLSNNPNNIVNDGNNGAIVGETKVNYYKIGLCRYNEDYLWWIFFGKDVKNDAGNGVTVISDYAVPAVTTPTAAIPWTNGLPGMTRFQALKYCVVSTWLRNQAKVWWGFRYLDGNEEGKSTVSPDNGNASSTAVTRDIRLFRPASNSSTADPKLRNFVQTVPNGSTPLTYAFANGYTQLSLNKDASSTFGTSQGGGQSGTENPIPACRTTFTVVFTDGIANDTSSGDGSAIGTGSDVYAQGNAAAGNALLTPTGTSLTSALTPGTSKRFNIWTLAAVAAHYPSTGYTSPTATNDNRAVGAAAPFLISDRGATTSNMRRIRTMTVGMSLFGNLTDAAGGKSSMYRAALYGNPNISTWVNPTSANPTPAFDPSSSSANDRTVNPFFFDAQSIDQLTAAMEAVVAEAITASGSVSAPSAPLVGLSLGREAFLGLFQPASSGPLWRGDLLAAGLKITSTADTFLGNDGNPVTSVNSENAIWSAGDLLQSEGLTYNFQATQYADPSTISGTGPRSWKLGKRKVITNVSGTTLVDLDESTSAITKATVGASTDADRVAYLRFLRGAHASAESSAISVSDATSINRITIMGDIISSSPAVLEYPLKDSAGVSTYAQSTVLSSVITTSWHDMHFRVIFVADNQGYIHAFGELAGLLYSGSAPNIVETPIAAVDELWAFFPGELLAGMPKYLRTGINGHIYGVDGPPLIYFDDQPGTGKVAGDGIVNGTDVVRLIVGMGKGGRNYYAFNVKDPFSPLLSWKLIPDSSSDTVVQKMGLATSTPALARVEVGTTTTDVVFIGGGLSTKLVNASMGATLGRNLVAVNTVTGAVLKTWDFSDITDMGSITAPVVPVEFLPNTGRAHRVYFADQPFEATTVGTGPRGSGLWALGSTALASNGVIRLDSSDLNNWTGGTFTAGGLRKVFQAAAGQVISTSPVPFRLTSPYPVVRTATPFIRPAVMGLLFSSGDRNDPLDRDLINPGTGIQNQMMMVFDRQDSASMGGLSPLPASGSSVNTNGFTDADLYDLTTVSSTTDPLITPTNASYYLKSKFGYKLLMGASTNKTTSDAGGTKYYPKAPSAPAALDGVLFFGVLKPGNVINAGGQAVACTGTGQTTIFRMCNLMAPVFASGAVAADLTTFNQNASNCSGSTLTFANIPGPLTGLGSVGILVSGQGKTSTGDAGSISTAGAEAQVVPGKTQNFGFRMKTWRIVR